MQIIAENSKGSGMHRVLTPNGRSVTSHISEDRILRNDFVLKRSSNHRMNVLKLKLAIRLVATRCHLAARRGKEPNATSEWCSGGDHRLTPCASTCTAVCKWRCKTCPDHVVRQMNHLPSFPMHKDSYWRNWGLVLTKIPLI
jgi:hypothetical protein